MKASLSSPVGPLSVTQEGDVITVLDWGASRSEMQTELLKEAVSQLEAYFAGELHDFDLPLDLGVSPFRRAFSQALIDIPFGDTRTYGDLAKELGVSAQAIGQACGSNRIPILIPCHRVLGATSLGGFSGAGGIEAKVALLKREGAAGLLI